MKKCQSGEGCRNIISFINVLAPKLLHQWVVIFGAVSPILFYQSVADMEAVVRGRDFWPMSGESVPA